MDDVKTYLEYEYTKQELFIMVDDETIEEILLPELKTEFPNMTESQFTSVLDDIYTEWEIARN